MHDIRNIVKACNPIVRELEPLVRNKEIEKILSTLFHVKGTGHQFEFEFFISLVKSLSSPLLHFVFISSRFLLFFSSNEPTLVSSTSNLHSRSSSPGVHHSGSSSSNHSSSQDLSKNLSNQDLRSSSTERVSRELPSLDHIQRQETGAQYTTSSTSPPPPVESNRSPPPPRSSSVTTEHPSVSVYIYCSTAGILL